METVYYCRVTSYFAAPVVERLIFVTIGFRRAKTIPHRHVLRRQFKRDLLTTAAN
jgi:hypothetical protein